MSSSNAPAVTGVHHLSLTVTDIEASLAWYERVLGWQRGDERFPHYAKEETGYGILVTDPRSGMVIGLHHNTGNAGESFAEARTGLDHVSFAVADRADLESWVSWLEEQDVAHTGIRDLTEPFVFSTVVFRDPDGIQLELVAFG